MWNFATDKKVQKQIYKSINDQKYDETIKILDIGIESYNIDSKKDFFNDKIKYYQLDPNKQFSNNDGFLFCKVEDSIEKFPMYENFFDIILDFGVFGWNGVKLNNEQRIQYLSNINRLLKPNGTYILHSDREPRLLEHKIDFDNLIPMFFSYKKYLEFDKIITINCPNYGTIWDIRFLNTHK